MGSSDSGSNQHLQQIITSVIYMLSQHGSFEEKTKKLLEEICRVVDANQVTLRVPDAQNQNLLLVDTYGADRHELGETLLIGTGIAGTSFQRTDAFVANDLSAMAADHALAVPIQSGMKSAAGLPIKAGAQLAGVLTVLSNELGHFTPGRLALLSAIAEGIGVAFENARLHQQLSEHADQLEAANWELEAFTYSVSHDLRAPLRGIDGFSQALLEDYADKLDEQGVDHLKRVRAASQFMGQLIEGLLKLSRLSRTEIRRQNVDLSATARTIAANLRKRQPERQVKFVIGDSLVAQGDPVLLQVVLENLLDNAWKYTSKHPTARVEFGLTNHNGKEAFFVRDDGAGFDMAYVDKLFGTFQRLHGRSEFEGTGIGLATVQRIINRHGGQVWAEGTVERGATFYFALKPERIGP